MTRHLKELASPVAGVTFFLQSGLPAHLAMGLCSFVPGEQQNIPCWETETFSQIGGPLPSSMPQLYPAVSQII